LLLNAFRAMQRGATLEAERLYRDILAIYPNEVEAWWHLGEVLFHGGPLQGRSLGDSRDAWERVLFFDPNDFFALLHLLRIAAAEEDSVRIDSLTTRVLRLTLESAQILEIRAFRTLAIDNQARKEQILTELRQADDLTVWRTVWNLSVYSSDLQDAEQVAKILTEPSRSAEVQAIGHVALAHLELARGRWKAAKAGLAAAKALHPVSAVEFRALLSAAPFLSLHPTELKVMQTEVAQLNVAALPRSASTGASFASHNDLHNHLKVYLLGLLSSRLGEHGKAQGYAKKLEKLGGRCEAIALTGDLVQSLHAQVAWRKGHPEKALEAIKQRRMEAPYEVLVESPFISQALERYVNAELLTVLERYEEALPWYGSFAQHSIYDLIYLAPAHLRRAQIYERLEQQDKVVEHYTRFIELWQDCDPELKPKVVNAKDRLAQIRPKLM
jgi:tetratricopeptide (TPR) repeat protein